MKSVSAGLVVALVWLLVAMVPNAGATDYTVGDTSSGWTTGYDYTTWTATKTFVVGDNIIFKYNQPDHDVVEVTSANYDSCTSTNSISQKQTGNDIVPLTTEGTRYFICSISSHCSRQMKISITTTASTSTSSPSTNTTTPSTTTTPSPPSPSDASSLSLSLSLSLLAPLFCALTSLLPSFL